MFEACALLNNSPNKKSKARPSQSAAANNNANSSLPSRSGSQRATTVANQYILLMSSSPPAPPGVAAASSPPLLDADSSASQVVLSTTRCYQNNHQQPYYLNSSSSGEQLDQATKPTNPVLINFNTSRKAGLINNSNNNQQQQHLTGSSTQYEFPRRHQRGGVAYSAPGVAYSDHNRLCNSASTTHRASYLSTSASTPLGLTLNAVGEEGAALPLVTVLERGGAVVNRKLSFDSVFNSYQQQQQQQRQDRQQQRRSGSCRSSLGLATAFTMDFAGGHKHSTASNKHRWVSRSRTGSVVGALPNLPHAASMRGHKFSAPASPQPSQHHSNVQVKISGSGGGGGGPPSPVTGDPQVNPLWNVSNEYMRVAGYSTPFNKLLSIKRKKPATPLSPQNAQIPSTLTETDGNRATDGGANQTKDTNIVLPLDVNNVAGLKGNKSQRSVYGRLYTSQTNQKQIFKQRKDLFAKRIFACNLTIVFAMIGLIMTIIEAELTGFSVVNKTYIISNLLRSLILCSTIILLALLMWYHAIEIKISVIDCGAHDWRVTLTVDRVFQMLVELILCAICPVPGNFLVDWVVIDKDNHRTISMIPVPLDVLLSIPMFSRFYLLGRFMALHSGQFQDAATRSIARLNRVTVNFGFVLKTQMVEHPLRVLFTFTVVFWLVISWISVQCERYDGVAEDNNYLNAIWFTVITFMSIGYGDVVPNTYCGRVVAITTGIVGAGVSSALIAVMSLKLELSRAEKHVNNFMTDTKLNRQRKVAAATVLQHTWFIHKYKSLDKAQDEIKLRFHQRKFLASINEFRRIKWEQRKLAEQGQALVDVAKLQSDMHTILWEMQHTQDQLANQIEMLNHRVQNIYDSMIGSKVNATMVSTGQNNMLSPTSMYSATHGGHVPNHHHPLSPVSETKSNET